MDRRLLWTGLAVALCGGCDGAPGPGEARAAGATVAVPPAIAASRAVDRGRLVLELTVDGSPVPTDTLPDGRRRAAFPLRDDDVLRVLVATWRYDLGDGTFLILARSDPVAVRFDEPGGILVDGFDAARFDADRDGASNLEEIDANRNPLYAGDAAPPPTVGFGQGDCRLVGRDELGLEPPLPPATRPPALFTLDGPLDETFLVTPEPVDGTAFHATLAVTRLGNVFIEHVGGLPLDTDAVLYERRDVTTQLGGPDTVQTIRDTTVDEPDELRARLPRLPTTSFPLNPGIYCYALFARPDLGSTSRPPLLDTSVRLRFEPRDVTPGR